MVDRPKHVNAKLDRDKHVVEAIVRQYGPISRAGIHELTELRPTTTSQIVRQLLEQGRLVEDGVEDGHVGRKGALLRLDESYGYVAGATFDDEVITAGSTDLAARVTRRIARRVPAQATVANLSRQLKEAIREVMDGQSGELVGVGIADPGLVDSRRGVTVTSSTMPFWRNVPLQAMFEREFRVPVLVETATRAKTEAERDPRVRSMIYLDYGAGIGAGFYVDGRLLYGQGSAVGEFGHTRVVDNDVACNCGSFGCLEAIAGLRAVESRFRRAVADGGKTDILERVGGEAAAVTGWMVFEASSGGDKIASNLVSEIARYLGLGIANLVNLLNPAEVVLDWRLRVAGAGFLDQISALVKRQALRESTAALEIRYGTQGEDAGLIGLAQMMLDKHFEIPALKLPRYLLEAGREDE